MISTNFKIFMMALAIALVSSGFAKDIDSMSLSIISIKFDRNKPSINDSYITSVNNLGADQLDSLSKISEFLKGTPGLGVRVVGFSDKNECSSKECYALALRRAELIYRWLISSGVPSYKLTGPLSEGDEYIIEKNDNTEDGLRLNRRVQFEPYPINGIK